ncbi:hypothetical protein CAPTEDRAFT_222201 [Capitella teleta]|uniref:Peptidase M28 domain-containing protein n=1 Tax=Capitella teleta TaxID=283909 RepID=R7UEQ8_CAPTE|nr:hypothetical protein CAPTEDRAFT_222201 [Capitella teleta]|eukprot:ELU01767.1 hypothetical protein CAPTEDRAFT_222201 [Capitella teleta]
MTQSRWTPVKTTDDVEAPEPAAGASASSKVAAPPAANPCPVQETWPDTWKVALLITVMCGLFVGGVLIGYFLQPLPYIQSENNPGESVDIYSQMCSEKTLNPEALLQIHSQLPSLVAKHYDNSFIEQFEDMTILSNTAPDQQILDAVISVFEESAMSSTLTLQYLSVSSSLPSPSNANSVRITDSTSHEIFYENFTSYVAYSSAQTSKGSPVYLNFAAASDFDFIIETGVDLQGSIGIMRLGHEALLPRVERCAKYGMGGLLVFSETDGCSDKIPSLTLNERGGDPSTIGYPSIDGIPRSTRFGFPLIAVQTISCRLSLNLLSLMFDGDDVFNLFDTPSFVPKSRNHIVEISTHNILSEQEVGNAVGTLRGASSPDEFVMIGANRNSFQQGRGVHGTAALLSLIRALSELYLDQLWSPKRSILFASWGGGSLGQIGAQEFIESNQASLQGKIVAYIDLDDPLTEGSEVLVTAEPSIESLLYEVAERVGSPVKTDSTLYDDWLWPSHYDHPVVTRTCHHGNTTTAFCNIWQDSLGCEYVHIQYGAGDKAGLLALALTDAALLQIDIKPYAEQLTLLVYQMESAVLNSDLADSLDAMIYDIMLSVEEFESFRLNLLSFMNSVQMRSFNKIITQFISIASRAIFQLRQIRLVDDKVELRKELITLTVRLNSALQILKPNSL